MSYRDFRDPGNRRRVHFRADEQAGVIEIKQPGGQPQRYQIEPNPAPGQAIRIVPFDRPVDGISEGAVKGD